MILQFNLRQTFWIRAESRATFFSKVSQEQSLGHTAIEESRKGVIAYSYSEDGVTWKYGQVVLQTDYHLSYPYIFKVKDKI